MKTPASRGDEGAPNAPARRGIAVAGSMIVNHLKTVYGHPPEGQMAMVAGRRVGTGGGAYNVLTGLATLGAPFPVEAIGVVGADPDGERIVGHLQGLGVDTGGIRVTRDAWTSASDVFIRTDTGMRTVFHDPGANALLSAEDFDFSRIRAAYLHLACPLLLPALDAPDPSDSARPLAAAVFESARAAGMITCMDVVMPLPFQVDEVIAPMLPHTDLLVANEQECEAIAGICVRDGNGNLAVSALAVIAGRLFDMGLRRTAVIHMREGAYAMEADGVECFVPARDVPPEEVMGTAGAGDAFCTGFLYGLHEGWGVAESLELAVGCATCSLLDATCTGGMRSLAETRQASARYAPYSWQVGGA